MSSKNETTATKDDARPALVPKLRFPEFRGAEGWKGVPLSELVGALDAGVSVNSGDRPAMGNEIGVLKTSAVTNGVFEPQQNKVVFDVVERGRVKEPVQGGTIIISRMNTPALVGANAYVETTLENIYLPDRLWAAKSRLGTSMRFVAYVLGSDKGRAALSKLAKGSSGSMKNITKLDVLAFLILAPSSAEQQKIAGCLSSVDDLMAAQARKVDALKTHKKGLMQQLFPREGETQPRLRFPEFQNAGEWSEGRIADIATVLQGYGFPERHQGQTSGDYPFYKVSDISRSLAAGKVFIEKSANYINEALLKELRAKPIPEGTTIFAKIGEAIRSNKRAITSAPCLIDNNAAGLKRIKGKATDLFIYLLMERISLIDHAGGVVPAVNKSAIEEIPVKFPGPDEQDRIASCLNSLEALVSSETQKLETLKTHKKGLMQQLFPSAEDVDA